MLPNPKLRLLHAVFEDRAGLSLPGVAERNEEAVEKHPGLAFRALDVADELFTPGRDLGHIW